MKTNKQIKEIKKALELFPSNNKQKNIELTVQVGTLSKYLNGGKAEVIESLKQYIEFYHSEKQYPTFNANAMISINALIEIIKEIEDQELYQELLQIKNNTMEVK